MGRGSRHSKNAGTMGAESLTYSERKAMGYGTFKERLGTDSMGSFNDCCLSLRPAIDPVVTPEGYIFSREAILESLLSQKKTIKRKRAAWEAAQKQEEDQAAEKDSIARQSDVLAFDRANHMGISNEGVASIKSAISSEAEALHAPKLATSVVAIGDNRERLATLKAYWAPSLAPEAKQTVEKPDADTKCPASGKKLKLKDLITVKFTPDPSGEKGKYMDPLTKDTLTNVDHLVVIRPTGDVLLKTTYEKLVKKDGDVYEGHKLGKGDVIELKTGGTGFAARGGEKVQASSYYIVGAGSGRQDLRGQMAGAKSLGGLSQMN